MRFFRSPRACFLPEKFQKLYNSQQKGLKVINLTIITRIGECVPLPNKQNGCFVWIPFVRLFLKLLRTLSSLVQLSRLLNGCGVLQPSLLFSSYIYQAFFSLHCHIFCLPLLRCEIRTTVFILLRAMGYPLVIAAVLTLWFVVFGRILGQYFDNQRLYLISVLMNEKPFKIFSLLYW